MPRGVKTPRVDPLADLKARIKAAEKAQQPVSRENIGIDAESMDTLAVLVERGMGTKVVVLRNALATGLRVLKSGSDTSGGDEVVSGDYPRVAPEEIERPFQERPFLAFPPQTYGHHPLISSVIGGPAMSGIPNLPDNNEVERGGLGLQDESEEDGDDEQAV